VHERIGSQFIPWPKLDLQFQGDNASGTVTVRRSGSPRFVLQVRNDSSVWRIDGVNP
jgi:hypothetical protein